MKVTGGAARGRDREGGSAFVPAAGDPAGVTFLPHTADAGLEASGGSPGECFARAAAGMFALFLRPTGSGTGREVQIEVEATSMDELLLAWLEELLYLSEAQGMGLVGFTVDRVGAGVLAGSAEGVPFGAGVEQVGPAVKAVTRHGLELRSGPPVWQARVYFDV